MKRLDLRILLVSVTLILPHFAAPAAFAALTSILDSPDTPNEPNLIGVNPLPDNQNPSVLETLYGETNLRRVDDSLDVAFRHTGATATVKAVARFNNPSIEETFRFYRLTDSFSKSVLRFQRVAPNFFFPVGYNPPTQLDGLIQQSESGPLFEVGVSSSARSNPARNPAGQDKMVTFEVVGAAGHPNNQVGNYVVGFEYFGLDDFDFQDVVYELHGVVPVPEPSALLLALLAAPAFRRQRGPRSTINE